MFGKVLKALKSPEVQKIKSLVEKREGKLVLLGTDLPVTTALEGLAEGKTVSEISEEYEVPEEDIRGLLYTTSSLINAFLT